MSVGVDLRTDFGDFVLDPDRRQLLRRGEEVHLSPKAFELLKLLVDRRPKALSKNGLHEHLWPATFVSETNLASLIAEIREALGDDARRPRYEAPTSIKGVTQSPIEGHSFAHAFDDAKAPSEHITQYFEMFGHRSIYHDGWRAVCPWPGTSFTESGRQFGAPMDAKTLSDQDAKHWELYHIDKDFAENHDVAESNRDKLIEMISLWYVEAGKYNVLPIDSRGQLRLGEPRPQLAVDRKSYQYYQGTQTVPTNAAVNTLNRPYSITVDAEIPPSGAEGVLLSHGGNDGGFSLYVQAGKLHYAYNYVADTQYHFESKETVPPGRHKLRYEFEPSGKADVGQGARGARARTALHRWDTRRPTRSGQDDPPLRGSRRRCDGRRRSRLTGDRTLQAAVHVYRHHPHRRHRCQR